MFQNPKELAFNFALLLPTSTTENVQLDLQRKKTCSPLTTSQEPVKSFPGPGFPDQADHNLTILWHH